MLRNPTLFLCAALAVGHSGQVDSVQNLALDVGHLAETESNEILMDAASGEKTSSGTLNLRGNKLMDSSGAGDDDNDGGLGAVALGFLLWCLVPIFLWNNERIAVKQYKMQFKAEKWAVHIDDENLEPVKEMEGKIHYISGVSEVLDEELQDSEFKEVKSKNKVKLRRVVEMYQWVETERKVKRGDREEIVYDHKMEWRDTHSTCPHGGASKVNPAMPCSSTSRQAPRRLMSAVTAGNGPLCPEVQHKNFKLGKYYLGEHVIQELTRWERKPDVEASQLKGGPIKGEADFEKADGFFYFGKREEHGAVRVKFEELCPGPMSIIGVLVKNQTGWTFGPIIRSDALGAGDSCGAEFGNALCPCLFRVKELHYGEKCDLEGFREAMRERPEELQPKEMSQLSRATTAANLAPAEDIDDLCCASCFGGQIVALMHWLGLEEEFLAVSEKEEDFHRVLKQERTNAENRHHMARIVGFFCLMGATNCILQPIVAVLNYNWLTTLLGGGLISCVLVIAGCLFSIIGFLIIVSLAWLRFRPWLSCFGFALAGAISYGIYAYVQYRQTMQQETSPGIEF